MKRVCDLCGGSTEADELEIPHAVDCPNHRDAIDDTPVEPVRSEGYGRSHTTAAGSRVASMASARFDRATHPEELGPRDALVAALDWFDSCSPDEKPTHVIVMIGRDTPGKSTASGTKFFQAGTYRHHAQMGLCLEAMHQIRDSG